MGDVCGPRYMADYSEPAVAAGCQARHGQSLKPVPGCARWCQIICIAQANDAISTMTMMRQ